MINQRCGTLSIKKSNENKWSTLKKSLFTLFFLLIKDPTANILDLGMSSILYDQLEVWYIINKKRNENKWSTISFVQYSSWFLKIMWTTLYVLFFFIIMQINNKIKTCTMLIKYTSHWTMCITIICYSRIIYDLLT